MTTTLILNIAITLVFIYLIVALIVTAVNETFFTLLRTRSKFLKRAIENLFFDKEWKQIAGQVKDSPFIRTLQKAPKVFPAVIPTKTFIDALLCILGKGKMDLDTIRAAITSKPEKGELFTVLQALMSQPEMDLDKLKQEIGQIYDNAMDRITGWFRRYARILSMFFALIITAGLNIDTIDITLNLWKNKERAEKLATFATTTAQQIEQDTVTGRIVLQDSKGVLMEYERTSQPVPDTVAKQPAGLTDNPAEAAKDQVRQIVQSYNILVDLGIPLGWSGDNVPACTPDFWDLLIGILLKIAGILITAAAVSMGAPFWFDILKRLSLMKKATKE